MVARGGHSMIEVALLAPWLFFLFVGICDFGFYAHALISTENAARAAALASGGTSGGGSQPLACSYALGELQGMPNSASLPASCNAPPLRVNYSTFTDAENHPGIAIEVSYQPIPLIPIPGVLPSQLTITRTVEMPVFQRQ